MNYKQFRDTLKEQKLKHHDKVKVMLHKADGGQGYIIGIINLKVNPCELCISYDHNNTGKIDTDFVYGINIDRVVSIELIKD
jgi:hypothetical protein